MYDESDPVFLTVETKVIRGVRRLLTPQSPVAGSEWTVTVPGGRLWRLLGGQSSFATDATVGNRFVGINVASMGATVAVNGNLNAIAASGNVTPVYASVQSALPNGSFSGRFLVPITPMWLQSGDTISSLTIFGGPADAYTNVRLVIEEAFFDPSILQELYTDKARMQSAFVRAME